MWDVILPIDFHIFQDGYCTTNQYIPFPLIFHDQYSIVSFPINSMVIFHSYVNVYQRVSNAYRYALAMATALKSMVISGT